MQEIFPGEKIWIAARTMGGYRVVPGFVVEVPPDSSIVTIDARPAGQRRESFARLHAFRDRAQALAGVATLALEDAGELARRISAIEEAAAAAITAAPADHPERRAWLVELRPDEDPRKTLDGRLRLKEWQRRAIAGKLQILAVDAEAAVEEAAGETGFDGGDLHAELDPDEDAQAIARGAFTISTS